MNGRPHFLKDDNLYNDIITIINDKTFSISKYNIKPSYIIEKLNKRSKIQITSANKILLLFNEYYNTGYKIEDLFNIDMLINYSPDYNTEYSYDEGSIGNEGIDRIINSIINTIKDIFGFVVDTKNTITGNTFDNEEEHKKKLKIIFFIMLFIFINVSIFIYFNQK